MWWNQSPSRTFSPQVVLSGNLHEVKGYDEASLGRVEKFLPPSPSRSEAYWIPLENPVADIVRIAESNILFLAIFFLGRMPTITVSFGMQVVQSSTSNCNALWIFKTLTWIYYASASNRISIFLHFEPLWWSDPL